MTGIYHIDDNGKDSTIKTGSLWNINETHDKNVDLD